MFVRVLLVLAVTLYIFGAIGVVSYLGGSVFWLIPVLSPAMYFIFALPDISHGRADLHYTPALSRTPNARVEIEARIAALKAGPPHRNKTQYIDSVSRGIPYSDDRIDYLEFPDRLVLCEHLRPLERVLRSRRLPMEHVGLQFVEVAAVFRLGALRERYQLPDCVVFTASDGPDNHAPPVNGLACETCGAVLRESYHVTAGVIE